MGKLDPARIGQILANVGVLAGIVFLAVEVRQNNEFLAAEARFNRVVTATESITIIAESPDLADYLWRANNGQALEPVEGLRLQYYLRRTFTNMEWAFREVPEELLPVATWRRLMAEPFRRSTWEELKEEYDSGLVAFIDEAVLRPQ